MTDDERDPWRELNAAAQTVREVGEKVDRDREANERLAVTNEERIKASVRKFRAWRFAGIVGILLGVLALWAGWRANDAVDQIRAQRTEARLVACHADNASASKVNALNDRTQDLLRNATASNTTRTPEQQARSDAFLADELAKYEAVKVHLRDCSPAGIERFYSNK